MKTPKLVVQNTMFSELIVQAACHTVRLGDGYPLYLARTGTKPAMKLWICPQQYSLQTAPRGWNQTRMKDHTARVGSDHSLSRGSRARENNRSQERAVPGSRGTRLLSPSLKYAAHFALSQGAVATCLVFSQVRGPVARDSFVHSFITLLIWPEFQPLG